jgi:hypothetical protein
MLQYTNADIKFFFFKIIKGAAGVEAVDVSGRSAVERGLASPTKQSSYTLGPVGVSVTVAYNVGPQLAGAVSLTIAQ